MRNFERRMWQHYSQTLIILLGCKRIWDLSFSQKGPLFSWVAMEIFQYSCSGPAAPLGQPITWWLARCSTPSDGTRRGAGVKAVPQLGHHSMRAPQCWKEQRAGWQRKRFLWLTAQINTERNILVNFYTDEAKPHPFIPSFPTYRRGLASLAIALCSLDTLKFVPEDVFQFISVKLQAAAFVFASETQGLVLLKHAAEEEQTAAWFTARFICS